MGFLDRRPFDATDPDGRALLEALYYRVPDVSVLVSEAGMHPADFVWDAPMAQVWPQVLRRAADCGRLRRLVTAVAQNRGSAAYGVIARLVAEPTEDRLLGDYTAQRGRADVTARMSALVRDCVLCPPQSKLLHVVQPGATEGGQLQKARGTHRLEKGEELIPVWQWKVVTGFSGQRPTASSSPAAASASPMGASVLIFLTGNFTSALSRIR